MGDVITPLNGVILTKLDIIKTDGGYVLHGLKNSEKEFIGFGEVYFSTVDQNAIKGWKRHRLMTLNLVVPHGAIRIVLFDARQYSDTFGRFQVVRLARDNYFRLTVPPLIWVAFQGLDNCDNILLNLASIGHDPTEADKMEISELEFEWSKSV
jgi:dTDP-4-dehydrorhamnose 3,5-epimerase